MGRGALRARRRMNPPANVTKSLRDYSGVTLADTSATLVPQGLCLVSRRIHPPACPAEAAAMYVIGRGMDPALLP